MTDLQKTVLVTAASGKTGRRCVDKLLARGASVRALVRRLDAADALKAVGVRDVIVGDLFDAAILRTATQGVSCILHICPPMHPAEDTLAALLTQIALAEGVERFVLYSVMHPHIDVPHHRRKLKAEADLIASGLPFTILQPCRYMQHVDALWPEIVGEGVHRMPFSTNARFSLVHIDDLAEAAAIVTTQNNHECAIYELGGPQALNQSDCARIISSVLGREITAQARPLQEFLERARLAGMPEARLNVLEIMNRHYDAHGLQGNGNVLRWLLGRAPISFEEHVRALSLRT